MITAATPNRTWQDVSATEKTKNMTQINLEKLFRSGICSFDMAKQLAEKGITTRINHLWLAYDAKGELISGRELMANAGYAVYPAIDYQTAIVLLEEVFDNASEIEVILNDSGQYQASFKGARIITENIVDLILNLWQYLTTLPALTAKSQ